MDAAVQPLIFVLVALIFFGTSIFALRQRKGVFEAGPVTTPLSLSWGILTAAIFYIEWSDPQTFFSLVITPVVSFDFRPNGLGALLAIVMLTSLLALCAWPWRRRTVGLKHREQSILIFAGSICVGMFFSGPWVVSLVLPLILLSQFVLWFPYMHEEPIALRFQVFAARMVLAVFSLAVFYTSLRFGEKAELISVAAFGAILLFSFRFRAEEEAKDGIASYTSGLFEEFSVLLICLAAAQAGDRFKDLFSIQNEGRWIFLLWSVFALRAAMISRRADFLESWTAQGRLVSLYFFSLLGSAEGLLCLCAYVVTRAVTLRDPPKSGPAILTGIINLIIMVALFALAFFNGSSTPVSTEDFWIMGTMFFLNTHLLARLVSGGNRNPALGELSNSATTAIPGFCLAGVGVYVLKDQLLVVSPGHALFLGVAGVLGGVGFAMSRMRWVEKDLVGPLRQWIREGYGFERLWRVVFGFTQELGSRLPLGLSASVGVLSSKLIHFYRFINLRALDGGTEIVWVGLSRCAQFLRSKIEGDIQIFGLIGLLFLSVATGYFVWGGF